MLANRILSILVGILAFVVVPVQLVTTFVLGLLVNISFGILLLPISLIWALLVFPLIGLSWLSSKIEWLRNPIGLLGIPWALLANTFVALMPSMGEIENRASKLMLTESWPYSWEFWRFQSGKVLLYGPECLDLNVILERITRNDPLMVQTLNTIVAGQPLDSNV